MAEEPVKLKVVKAQPIEELIECLESLLERARSGKLRSIVYLGFEQDGGMETGNSGERFNKAYVVGAFQVAAWDYYHRRREDGN